MTVLKLMYFIMSLIRIIMIKKKKEQKEEEASILVRWKHRIELLISVVARMQNRNTASVISAMWSIIAHCEGMNKHLRDDMVTTRILFSRPHTHKMIHQLIEDPTVCCSTQFQCSSSMELNKTQQVLLKMCPPATLKVISGDNAAQSQGLTAMLKTIVRCFIVYLTFFRDGVTNMQLGPGAVFRRKDASCQRIINRMQEQFHKPNASANFNELSQYLIKYQSLIAHEVRCDGYPPQIMFTFHFWMPIQQNMRT